MDEEQWLRRLLEACDRGIARLHEPGADPNAKLLADLEDYRKRLKRRLEEPRGLGGLPGQSR